jgi:hypothetical protein
MPHSKRIATVVASLTALGALGLASSASAGVAEYSTTSTFGVPNNTGQSGLPSQTFVPPGRTAVQKVELVGVKPSYGGGGGADLETRLQGPSGTVVPLFANACAVWPNTSAFTISDDATTLITNAAFCTNLIANPTTATGKPTGSLSAFNGQPSAGAWTVVVVDAGANNVTNGSWNGWTLRLTHAAPTVKGSAAKQTLGKTQLLSVTPDADGKVTVGGSAVKGPAVTVSADAAATIPFTVTKKVKKKVKKKGKATANVTVTLNDQTNGTATATVPVKLTAPK